MSYSKIPAKGKSIRDLALFIGCWEGTSGDDLIEEHWMSAAYGNMTGMFRWMKNGDVFIYELMALVEKNKEVLLYLRHFDKDFIGWEEKSTPMIFHLTEANGTKAVFTLRDNPEKGWIIYELLNSDILRFSDINADGSISFELIFKRQPKG
ncbi:MAG: DUF6265 family protein [Candidatus Thorarchaeota archaeon]